MRPAAIVCVLLLAACNGADQNASAAPVESPSAPISSAGAAGAEIVGEWRGEHECRGIIDALTEAGFDESVALENVVGNGLVPGAESPDELDPADPCADAEVLEHSHVFSADGRFQSFDAEGEEVDFGTYQVVDDDTLTIGAPDREPVEFAYTIEGDRLTLEPQLEEGCTDFECQWAVMVAMPWSELRRVDGSG